jgi:hypothetical protein
MDTLHVHMQFLPGDRQHRPLWEPLAKATLRVQLIQGAPPSPRQMTASTPTLGSSCNGHPPHANASRAANSVLFCSVLFSFVLSAFCRVVSRPVKSDRVVSSVMSRVMSCGVSCVVCRVVS